MVFMTAPQTPKPKHYTSLYSALRIGLGSDSHRYAEGKKLILGGIEIPYSLGLLGHSDADVLLHAIIDAVLGSLAWGDIGRWFPDTDEKYRGADSCTLFREVWSQCQSAGWELANCDCTVTAQEPKLAKFIPDICRSIAELFCATAEQVSVKAKTAEGMGALGRKEGIAAQAVVLLVRSS